MSPPHKAALFDRPERLCAEGGVFLFRYRQLGAVRERHLESADVADIQGIDKVALVAPQEQMTVMLFQRCDRRRHLDLSAVRDKNAVLCAVRRFDADDGVREDKVIRAVESVKMDPFAAAVQSGLRPVHLMEVVGIDHIVSVLLVRVGDVTEQNARVLFLVPLFILDDALTPCHQQSLIQGDILAVGIVGRDRAAEHHVTEGRM